MIYDKRTQRKLQILSLLIALLILIPILLDFSKGFSMGYNSSVLGFKNGLGESAMQVCDVKPIAPELGMTGTIPSLEIESSKILYAPMMPVALQVTDTLLLILSLSALVMLVIKLFQLIQSVPVDGLMNRRTIKRMRQLSIYMIVFHLSSYVNSVFSAYYYQGLDLGDYRLCYPELSASVTVAFILMLLAEIINIAYKQREELDLTI